MVPIDRRPAKKAAKSVSAMRGRLPIRCTGRAPDLIQRRTVRGSTLRQVAMSLIVRKRGKAAAAAFPTVIGHATPKSRSSDGTLINRRAPIFVHSISPLFILL
jgi:hypothetical protein